MRTLFLLALFFLALPVCAEEYYPLDQAERYLQEGNPVAAYEILAPLAPQFTGGLRFDLLYGVAAVQSGHANLAILPLMRVVLQQPNNLVARYYLALAYMKVNDLQQAQQEYQNLLALNPAGAIRQRAEADLDQLEARLNRDGKLSFNGTVAFGYDSNANSATSVSTFLGYTLSQNSRQTASLMLAASGNWEKKQQSREYGSFKSGVYLQQVVYPQATFVNSSSYVLYWGWKPGRKNNSEGRHNFDAVHQVVLVDGRFNTQGTYLTYTNRGLGSKSTFTYYLRMGAQLYDPVYAIQDVSQLTFGLGKRFNKDDRHVRNASAILGTDLARQAGSPYTRVFGGVRYNTEAYGQQLIGYSSIGLLYSDYSGLFLGIPRTDRHIDLTLGWVTRPYGSWRPVIELKIVDTASSVALYDFTRYSLTVTLKQKK